MADAANGVPTTSILAKSRLTNSLGQLNGPHG